MRCVCIPTPAMPFSPTIGESYRPVAAQDMWHRVLLFYAKNLSN